MHEIAMVRSNSPLASSSVNLRPPPAPGGAPNMFGAAILAFARGVLLRKQTVSVLVVVATLRFVGEGGGAQNDFLRWGERWGERLPGRRRAVRAGGACLCVRGRGSGSIDPSNARACEGCVRAC